MSAMKRILLVEDEPLIAMMLEDFVEALGHEVAGMADSVATALALVEGGAFDLCILDVNLRGGEKSWPVADALAANGKAFVLATGGSTGETPATHAAAPQLSKPYTLEAVGRALDRLLS